VLESPSEARIEGFAESVTLGAAFTKTVTFAVLDNPAEFVPVQLYVVVLVGLTTMLAVVSPVLHR